MFYSFQGEGVHMGKPAYFVRLMGCDQSCSFCDSAATWHKDWKPANARRLTASQILQEVKNAVQEVRLKAVFSAHVPFVVLTGGEPALWNLQPLVSVLRDFGFDTHIETAGHKPLPFGLKWKTVSPKFFATPPLPENLARADEIKLVCTSPAQIESDLAKIREVVDIAPVWLHPEWSQRDNPQLLRAIVETVKSQPGTRAGYQLHKLFAADWLDEGADRRFVPLGGVAR